MRRPDATDPALKSGVNVSYDGLKETRTEVAPVPAGAAIATTTLVTDVFGRLVEVHELGTATPCTPPAPCTTYTYSPRDEVASIRDPEQKLTLLEHDLGGRRTKITRGTRVWTYEYDRNGNMTSELTPVPGTQPPPDPLKLAYTTTLAYDDLDRLTSKAIAPRQEGDEGLTVVDRQLFGAHVVTLVWDGTVYNRAGRLAYFNTKGPDPLLGNVYWGRNFFDGEGNPTLEHRNWKLRVAPSTDVLFTERGEAYTWATFGKPQNVGFADGDAPEGKSSSSTAYDARGNPLRMSLARPGISGNSTAALQTRNVAGLVTKRRADQTGQAMTFVESNWTYDKLGRVTSQVVQKGPGPVQVARQDLVYWGNDDPKQLEHQIGTQPLKRFQFAYDTRHQLDVVSETAAGGVFSGDYGYGNAGRFASANVAATALPGSEVRTRDVHYEYSATDPEQVVALHTGSPTGPLYADYQYDAAGNQIRRSYYTDASGASIPTQTWLFKYDGEDQLRRVTAPDGSIEEYWYDQDARRALIRMLPAPPATGPIKWRWFHRNTEIEWVTDNGADTTPAIVETWAHASLGTPVARIQNRNDRTEFQFHGLASSTLATVESGVGVLDAGDPPAPASGTVNAAFTYPPWGEIIETAGSEIATHRRRLNDKYHDASSGLAYYGFRYYDQVSMTWTQSDPLYRFAPDAAWTAPRHALLYTFDLQNPNRYIDPDGRQAATLGGCALGGPPGCAAGAAVDLGGYLLAGGAVLATGVAAVATGAAEAVSDAVSDWWNSPPAWPWIGPPKGSTTTPPSPPKPTGTTVAPSGPDDPEPPKEPEVHELPRIPYPPELEEDRLPPAQVIREKPGESRRLPHWWWWWTDSATSDDDSDAEFQSGGNRLKAEPKAKAKAKAKAREERVESGSSSKYHWDIGGCGIECVIH